MEHPYPSINRYGPVNYLYGPLRGPPTPLQTTTDPPTAFTDPIRPLPPATHYTILYSIADISKQVSKG